MKIADVCFFYNNVLHVGWLLISSIFHEGELLVYYWCHQSSKILYHIRGNFCPQMANTDKLHLEEETKRSSQKYDGHMKGANKFS